MTKSQKRRERRIALAKYCQCEIDGDAYRQGLKLDRIKQIGCVQQPRINRTYTVDGFVFPSGKNHRHIG